LAPALAALAVHDSRTDSGAQAELEALEADVRAAGAQITALLLAIGEHREQLESASEVLTADLAVIRGELQALGRRQKQLAEAHRRVSEAAVADVEPETVRQPDLIDQLLAEAVAKALRSCSAAAP
jgi:hypothetical protein